jgi:hypothetical protein
MATINPTTSLVTVDLTLITKQVQLPLTTARPGRVITIKDVNGFAPTNPLVILTGGSEIFEDGSSSYTITDPFGFVTLVADIGVWRIIAESTVDINPIFPVITGSQVNASSISTGFLQAGTASTISTITNEIFANHANITTAYISSLSVGTFFAQIVSTSITQDVTQLIVDQAFISSAIISTLVSRQAIFGSISANSIAVTNLSAPIINLGFSSLSTSIGQQ